MENLQDIIVELQKRGPIDTAEFYRLEGASLSEGLVKTALEKISGEDGWDGYRYYYDVLKCCGCPPDTGASEALILAYERARKLLVSGPKNRAELDAILEQNRL